MEKNFLVREQTGFIGDSLLLSINLREASVINFTSYNYVNATLSIHKMTASDLEYLVELFNKRIEQIKWEEK